MSLVAPGNNERSTVEAYLTLIKDLNTILGNNWADTPSEEIKRRINTAIAFSLNIGI